jgi:hypothetical protein
VRLGSACGKPDLGLRMFVRLSPRESDRTRYSNLPVTTMSVPPPPSPIKVQLTTRYTSVGRGHKDHFHSSLGGRGRVYKRLLGVGGVGILLDGSKGRTPYSGIGLGYESGHFALTGEGLISGVGGGGRMQLFLGSERLAANGNLLMLEDVGSEGVLSLRARIRPNSALWLGVDGAFGDLKSLPTYSGGVGMRYAGRRLFLDMSFGVAGRAGANIGPATMVALALEVSRCQP